MEENTHAVAPPEELEGKRSLALDLSTNGTVFLTGAAVLVLEILGTRLLSPYFGNNIYVWSALITVTMIALAAGYSVGGKLADSQGGQGLLDKVIAVAAIWVGIIPSLVKTVAVPLLGLDYRIGILITALISFGPALFLLGMVTPVAVRLIVPDLRSVGRSAGTIYAWSTIGGIFGALAAGFFLFPIISVSRICHLTALILMALALSRFLIRSRRPLLAVGPALALAAAGGAHPGSFLPKQRWTDGGYDVLTNRPSFYGRVRVLESRGYRFLTIDGLCHNARSLDDGLPAMAHVAVFSAMPILRPEATTGLLIGLGGGDMVRMIKPFGLELTGVEIDPVVSAAAVEHFGLDPNDVEMVTADGRVYLRQSHKVFDLVLIDAFSGGTPPSHLFTREAYQEVKGHLSSNGVLGVNMVVTGIESTLIGDMDATLRTVFRHTVAYAVIQHEGAPGNVVFFASDGSVEIPPNWRRRSIEPALVSALEELPERRIDLTRYSGQVITDELNPVDALSAAAEIALRRDNLSFLAPSLIDP